MTTITVSDQTATQLKQIMRQHKTSNEDECIKYVIRFYFDNTKPLQCSDDFSEEIKKAKTEYQGGGGEKFETVDDFIKNLDL